MAPRRMTAFRREIILSMPSTRPSQPGSKLSVMTSRELLRRNRSSDNALQNAPRASPWSMQQAMELCGPDRHHLAQSSPPSVGARVVRWMWGGPLWDPFWGTGMPVVPCVYPPQGLTSLRAGDHKGPPSTPLHPRPYGILDARLRLMPIAWNFCGPSSLSERGPYPLSVMVYF